ncbi:MAG: LD-carboxypeptidase [Lachnoclostridium sp.]|nr:LD-carboxypeptidase [Lachnoclostridium sp.]
MIPAPLRQGDRIAVVSPSGIIAPERVFGAMQVIADEGFEPIAMPHAFDRCGTMAGTDAARLSDLRSAFIDPDIKAVFCSRGGYGAVRLLEELNTLPSAALSKWLIGYSDITALHALLSSRGIASLHGPMARHLSEQRGSDPCVRELFNILRGEAPQPVEYPTPRFYYPGTATGILRGGNLSVMAGLAGTPYDPFLPGSILIMEDIAEPIYKVERILYMLRLSGKLRHLAGIIFGQFTLYDPSRDFATMEEMLHRMTVRLGIPVATNFPAGHVTANRPLLLNTPATLHVTPSTCRLSYPT